MTPWRNQTPKRLTATLFQTLAPGGKLLVSNFLVGPGGRGYMEAFMEWTPLVRGRADIEKLDASMPLAEIGSRRYLQDPNVVEGCLELVRSRS